MDKFKLIKKEHINELNSDAFLYEHEKTKARVLKVENNDENKAFGIGFRTVQNDDTGVCHILEHSVLSGSRKYKTREPFMDLVKSSLQTFLNAMTFDDKTIYPISSRNEKDFFNLMDVYMDAVLFPNIYNNEKIFMQEGWHYELENKDAPLTINGVVYNEMKGAMSSDISQVMDKIARYLYPDSTYNTNPGGDPEFIPTISREALLDYHREKYHPSNSYIFLYGNGDTNKELEFLDGYLSEFEFKDVKNPMKYIKPLEKNIDVETTYFGEAKPKNDFFVVSYLAGDSTDNLNNLCHEVITRALVTEDGAPIKDRILSEGLATDVETMYSVGTVNNLSIIAKGMNAEDKDKILKIIDEEIGSLIKSGLDEKLFKSILHQLKYEIKTYGDTPHLGIMTYIRAFQTWLYDKDPIDALKFDDAFEKLENDSELVQKYAKDYFDGYRMTMLVKPDPELGKKREEELKKKLAEHKKSLSDEELEEIIKKTKELHEFQLSEDSEEAKKTLPRLNVKDLSDSLQKANEKIDGNISSCEAFTGGVTYMDALVPIDDMGDEKLQAITLLSDLIDRIDTEKYNYKDLNTEINLISYDFNVSIMTSKYYEKNEASIFLSKKLSSDGDDFEKAYDLFEEVHKTTVFDNTKKIKEILNTMISDLKLKAVMTGIAITRTEAMKNVNRRFAIDAKISGADYIKYIEKVASMDNAEMKKYLEDMYEIYKNIFDEKGFYHITSDSEGIERAVAVLNKKGLKVDGEIDKKKFALKNNPGTTTALVAITDVNYCIDAGILPKTSGSDSVVRNMLSNSFLHDNIRAKGGAYGDGINQSDDCVVFYSYRDPNLQNTFDVFEKSMDWLRGRDLKEEQIDDLIIGSYNSFDPNLTPRMRSLRDFSYRINETSVEDLEKKLKEALETKKEDFADFADRLEAAMKNKGRAVFTNEDGYEKSKDMWQEKKDLK